MQNLEGKTMGRLYVVKRIGFKYTKNGRYQNYLCRCECGNYCERTISKEWERFEPFAEWAMQSGYNDELTIDRIDNNKGYSPDNCRWATKRGQMENTRRTRKYTIDGETHSVTYWAREYGISRSTLFYRLERWMSIEEALTSHGKRRQVGDYVME